MLSTKPRRALIGGAVRPPWPAASWRDARFLAAGIPLSLPVWLTVTVPKVSLFLVGVILLGIRLLSAAQRARLRALRGVDVPPLLRPAGTSAGAVTTLRTAVSWRQVGYHLVVGPLVALGALAVLWGWGAAVVASTVFGWAWMMPSSSPVADHWAKLDVPLTVGGVALLAVLPWAVR
ncbi:sensor domain-containing protein, partial [Streptomyces sp. NRRL S-495]